MEVDKRFEWVVFDLGGVLVEITPDRFYQFISKEINVPIDVIKNYKEKMSLGYEDPEIIIREFISKYELNITPKYFINQFIELYIGKKIEGMSEFIQEIKKYGYKIGLLSNTNKIHINYLKPNFNYFKDFDSLFFSYEIHNNKPSPEVYRHVINKLSVNPEKILFIDDTYENIKVAESFGIVGLHSKMNQPSVEIIKQKLGVIKS